LFSGGLEIVAQTAPASHEAVKCVSLDGKACTWTQVRDLSAAAGAGKADKVLASFGSLTLASFDGTLKCEQADGAACAPEQIRAVVRIGARLKLRIWYRQEAD
jgi:hypothetical protein